MNQIEEAKTPQMFTVFVDDNFHYMDEDQRYTAGKFATYDKALAKAQEIVCGSLNEAFKPGMTAGELMGSYRSFGEDPWISPDPAPDGKRFSASTFASELADRIVLENSQTNVKEENQ